MLRRACPLCQLSRKRNILSLSSRSLIAVQRELQLSPAVRMSTARETRFRAEPLLRERREKFHASGCLFDEDTTPPERRETSDGSARPRCAGCTSDCTLLQHHSVVVNGVALPVCPACAITLRDPASTSESSDIRSSVELASRLAADQNAAELPIEDAEGLLFLDTTALNALPARSLNKIQWIRFGELPRRGCDNSAIETARNVVAFCPNCKEVTFSAAGMTVGEAQELSKFPVLTSLEIDCARMEEECLPELAKLRGLVSLRLQGIGLGITDVGMGSICQLHQLQELLLPNGVYITDMGLRELSKLRNLRALDLHHQKDMTAAGFAALATLTSLTALTVRGSLPKGALKEISKLRSLETLHVSSYHDDEETNVLSRLTQLTSLSVSCRWNSQTPSTLAKLRKLRSLDLKLLEGTVKDHLSELASLPELKSLTLRYEDEDDEPVCFEGLGKLTSLRTLCLVNCAISTEDLAKLRNLTVLQISDSTNITNAALSEIGAQMPHLKKLQLHYCIGYTDKGVGELGKLSELQFLSLWLNPDHADESALTEIGRLTKLKTLQLFGHGRIRSSLMLTEIVPKLSNLVSLRLEGFEVTDDGLEMISKHFPLLTSLHLTNCKLVTDKGLEALTKLTRLTDLHLGECHRITGTGPGSLTRLPLTSLTLTEANSLFDWPKSGKLEKVKRCTLTEGTTDVGISW
jgi:Leucine-rich repeat (LRR) protein